ncbi:MAG: AAA family ATPase [Phycisphaerales bacterium]|nr:MAG: AAA family ATPase [Phycisphaerales bacterium]
MLDYFRADNFKSLVNVSLEPTGLNLLVGSNNAGKTNLCHAMAFLSWTSRGSLLEASRNCTAEPWSLANVYLDKPTIDFSLRCALKSEDKDYKFDYELSLTAPRAAEGRGQSVPLAVHREVLRVTGGAFNDTVLMENDAGKVKLLHERVFLGEQQGPDEYVWTTAPQDHTMLFRLYDLETNQHANLFKRYLGTWLYFNLDARSLRDNTAQPLEFVLKPDGSNLASVLNNLNSSEQRLLRKIVDAAKTVEPKLDIIVFLSPDPEHVYMFFEDEKGKRFSATNISDGTLRYLALCTFVILNRRLAKAEGGVPLVMVEEPENGIFVGHLKPLFERIDPSGKEGQYLFTSHAPYFIDLFDSCLDGVWVAHSQRTHTTIERPPKGKMEKCLGEYSLGEMHFRGLLK